MSNKPISETLEVDRTARRHLFLVQGRGAETARRILRDRAYLLAQTLSFPDDSSLEDMLEENLPRYGMETAFYIAGPEAFVWKVTHILRAAGVERLRIHSEVSGNSARTVYCVHCGYLLENVTMIPVRCVQCGIVLGVRDCFSRRLGAYLGVMADANDPGAMLETEVMYA